MATVLSIAIFLTSFVTVGAMIAIQTLADTGGLLKRSREFNVNKTLLSRDLPGGSEGGESKRNVQGPTAVFGVAQVGTT